MIKEIIAVTVAVVGALTIDATIITLIYLAFGKALS